MQYAKEQAGRGSQIYQNAVRQWRNAQAQLGRAQSAYQAAQQNFDAAQTTVLNAGR